MEKQLLQKSSHTTKDLSLSTVRAAIRDLDSSSIMERASTFCIQQGREETRYRAAYS